MASSGSISTTPSSAGRKKGALTLALVPLGVAALSTGLVTWIHTSEFFDPANTNIASLVSVGVPVIGLGVWIFWWAPLLSRRTRRVLVGVPLSIIVALVICLRFDGFSGDLTPRIVPRSWLAFLLGKFDPRWAPRAIVTEAATPRLVEGKPATIERPAGAADSPQFFGPQRDGVVADPGLDTDWTAHPPHEIWRHAVGVGWSSFAVVDGYAITAEQRQDDELTVCYELLTGKEVWSHAEHVRFSEPLGGPGPRATPTIDRGRVYSMGATGILNCLDLTTGESIWRHDVMAENGGTLPMYGTPGSPLVVDGLVVVSAGAPDDRSLLAYDAASGKEIWHAGEGKISYASPVVATLAGVRQIVMVNAASVTGHNPADGRVLWNWDWPESGSQPTISQPNVIGGNQLLICKGYGIGAGLLNVACGDDASWRVERVWKNLNLKTKFSSAVVLDDGGKQFAFGLDENLLECLEPTKGKVQWKVRGYNFGQMLLVGKLLLIQNEDGTVALVAADPKQQRELTRFAPLSDKTWNVPVLAGRYLLVRNDREAACFELPLAKP